MGRRPQPGQTVFFRPAALCMKNRRVEWRVGVRSDASMPACVCAGRAARGGGVGRERGGTQRKGGNQRTCARWTRSCGSVDARSRPAAREGSPASDRRLLPYGSAIMPEWRRGGERRVWGGSGAGLRGPVHASSRCRRGAAGAGAQERPEPRRRRSSGQRADRRHGRRGFPFGHRRTGLRSCRRRWRPRPPRAAGSSPRHERRTVVCTARRPRAWRRRNGSAPATGDRWRSGEVVSGEERAEAAARRRLRAVAAVLLLGLQEESLLAAELLAPRLRQQQSSWERPGGDREGRWWWWR